MWSTERMLRVQGCQRIAGVDEAGRGPLAGPVIAAAVVLPGPDDKGYQAARRALRQLNDSKKVPPERRVVLAEKIRRHAVAYGIGQADVAEIDSLNILQASFLAMRRALAVCRTPGPEGFAAMCEPGDVDMVIVDGHLKIPDIAIRQVAIVEGDGLCAAIAAASILAKVHRDRLMGEAHEQYPVYGFDRHKGYPTPEHREILARLGPCPLHRQSFRPVQEAANLQLAVPPDPAS